MVRPVSEAGEGEGMASLADDLEDLRLEVTEVVRHQTDGIGVVEAGSSCCAAEQQECAGDQGQSGHLSLSLSLPSLRQ